MHNINIRSNFHYRNCTQSTSI